MKRINAPKRILQFNSHSGTISLRYCDLCLNELRPPSTPIICPVIQELSLPRRKAAKAAESSAVPTRGNGLMPPNFSCISLLLRSFEAMDVFDKPGRMQFTRTFGANSAAKDSVKPSTPPFAEAMTLCIGNPWDAAREENNTMLAGSDAFCNPGSAACTSSSAPQQCSWYVRKNSSCFTARTDLSGISPTA
eukprot:CAMPEP_0169174596 /NCGR_PEP_ID=MMETSP1015-20121227/64653_1 /TAXON_ID=342587 /ORGANISM="Karlodinium micrum, Strain CCMP2283" /LENGTH=190 /DNA_ID=CAMNT_0009248511 /DNA_START=76 /DNA_END=648 /DNA_ORIENTATION=+